MSVETTTPYDDSPDGQAVATLYFQYQDIRMPLSTHQTAPTLQQLSGNTIITIERDFKAEEAAIR